jgi:hypothetical protein
MSARSVGRLACSAVAVLCLTVALEAQRKAVILQLIPLRLEPDLARGPLVMMEAGVIVRLNRIEGAWAEITVSGSQWGDRTGYVEKKYIEVLPPEEPSERSPSGQVNRQAPEERPAKSGASTTTVTPTRREAPSTERTTNNATASTLSTGPVGPPAAAISKITEQPNLNAEVESHVTLAPRASRPFTNEQLVSNIQIGLRGKGRDQGLRLVDSAQRFVAALTANGHGPTASNGFTVSAYTPLAWVRQLASEAAKEYRPYAAEHVSDEALEPVFRVVVYPDTPNTVTAGGMRGTSSVQHVVLRNESREYAVQPLSKEIFVEEVSNALGGRASFEGLRVKFDMADVRKLRGSKGDREFFITVIGATDEEKNFRVKRKHFDDLP